MAGLLINLNQLETSMRRIKAYCDTNYSLKNHTHDDNYYTKLETINIINDSIEDFEIVSEGGNTTTITEVVNNVEAQSEKIVELENTTESQSEKIIQLENTIYHLIK